MESSSKIIKKYSAFLMDDTSEDDEKDNAEAYRSSTRRRFKTRDDSDRKLPWLNLSLSSNNSQSDNDINKNMRTITKKSLIIENGLNKNLEDLNRFKVTSIKNQSPLGSKNMHQSTARVDENNYKGRSQKKHSLLNIPISRRQTPSRRRVSTEFSDSLSMISADDLENNVFKSLLEDQSMNKKALKSSESPNLLSVSSSESFLKHVELQNRDNINSFLSPVLSKMGSKKPSVKVSQTNYCESQFSQFLRSTQFQRQIDEVISCEEEKNSSNTLKERNSITDIKKTCSETSSSISGKRRTPESLPTTNAKMQKVSELSMQNKENFNQSDDKPENLKSNNIEYRMTQLLHTNEYRKGMTQLFDGLEKSICQLGSNSNQFNKNISCKDWADNDSFIANLSLDGLIEQTENGSINDIIKRALKENATKAVQPQNLVNRTIVNTGVTFRHLGSFYGLPDKVQELIKLYKGIDKLYDWQDECLKLPAVKERKNLIYSLPTSGGKTLVAEILILREIICRKRNVIFVLPYVAIVQEKVWALSPFAVALDFLIEEYAAGKGTYPPRKRRYKNSVYIATTEKAVGLINSLVEQGRLEEIGLVVVDELHLIGDDQRGGNLEILLTKLMFLNEDIQIVGMSATIGNLPDIQKFLNAEVYTRNFRPVELTEYVKCGNEIAKVNCSADDDNIFEVVRKVDFSYSEAVARIDPDRLGGLVMEVIPKGSCLIFCSTKNSCENVTRLLSKIVIPKLKEYKAVEKQQLLNTLKNETGALCSILENSIPFGIAYHHSGLTSDERKLIEEGYRSGVIYVICCTSTLAAGVNLPAKRVIIRKPFIAKEFISLSRYKQMVGRAGRAGLGEMGESILICEKQDLARVRNLFVSPMDQTLSKIHEDNCNHLKHLFLSCIILKTATTKLQLENIANCTLLAVQQQRLNVDIKMLTKQAILKLFKCGAVQLLDDKNVKSNTTINSDVSVYLSMSEHSASSATPREIDKKSKGKKTILLKNDDKLVVSKLGKAAIKGCLELPKASLLYEDLKKAQESLVLLDCLHLLYLVTPYTVVEQTKLEKNHFYNILSRLGEKERKTAAILGITDFCIMRLYSNQNIKNIDERVLNRFYLALMLYDLWNEVSVTEASEKYRINRGIVQNLMTNAASFASNVVSFCEELEEFWAFAYLLKGMSQRLAHCCCRELLPLMELPAVKQGRARQLYNTGFKTLQSIAKADPNELTEAIEFMSRRLANQLIAAAKLLLLEKVETLREEAEDVLDGVENPKPLLNHSFFFK